MERLHLMREEAQLRMQENAGKNGISLEKAAKIL